MTLQPGKLPSELLTELLGTITQRDPRVLVGPGIGRDAAVIDLGGDRVLVAKTDPVTFATDHIGWYAVNVNANDIACMGARPAWFMATALLPPGADESLPRRMFDELNAACEQLGIQLVGGHTEVTLGIDRPIVVGAMLGEAGREEIVLGENIREGDCVLLTKGIAIEGTALLARESADALRERGVSSAAIARAAEMLLVPGISVVADARAICGAVKAKLLHDPTEGGIATALQEMAQAAGMTLRVRDSAIPIFEETREICAALALDPLGLLASGALLAIVAADDLDAAVGGLLAREISCAQLGRIEAGPAMVILDGEEPPVPFPSFARDELARFYDDASAV